MPRGSLFSPTSSHCINPSNQPSLKQRSTAMMKPLFTLVLVSALTISTSHIVSAQYLEPNPSADNPTFYLDLSTGLDNHTGIIGLAALFPFTEKVGLRTGIGLGAWGTKFGIGLKFENRLSKGWGAGIGYSHCPGMDDIDLTMTDQTGATREVNFDLLQVGSINFTLNHNWVFRNKNIFFIEFGYATPTGGEEFYRINDGSTLTPEEELVMNIIRPGGVILALGFKFAI